ncbi:type II toxin-antitoxin system mRNA interferase toxin, RelE/StbE family [Marinobacter sp. LV10R510-11A]|uniref:type II toxin-antitoxin system mRNA interferase toxin, RelE/StbE family n=1 Tax=Marinobacter sp. LV10R510-11A TaxID=1415568 RepID=UPI001D0D478D|nr:type II toxin-antitoxin system mRNA interferase toxin, RelE/StbE family [Marinobacter sp. LV10R510-11A]
MLDIPFSVYILYGMWGILEHRRVTKNLSAAPVEVQKRYEKWKDIVSISGPQGLKQIRGFNDEALSGKWKGFRSSRLNIQYRVIYKVQNKQVLVEVEKVTPHDYGRR